MTTNNSGNASSQYKGDTPSSEEDFLKRYQTDNFVLKVGMIAEVFAGGYVAQVTYGSGTNYAIWASKILGGISGTNDFSIPASGTRVLVLTLHSNISFILGAFPYKGFANGVFYSAEETEIDYSTERQHNILSSDELNLDKFYNNDCPLDALPGDVGWQNEYGNTISLLRGMISLKATIMSQIQLNQIDSLVRIISKNFEHLSEGKEHIEYNDHGSLSSETNVFTSLDESLGNTEESKTFIEGQNDLITKNEEVVPEPYPRIVCHNGRVGDLDHKYYRSEKQEQTNDDEIPAETLEYHVDNQGTLRARNTKGFKFVKTDKTFIPQRIVDYKDSVQKTIEPLPEFTYTEGDRSVQENEREAWESQKFQKQSYDPSEWEIVPHVSNQENPSKSLFLQRDDGSIIMQVNDKNFLEFDAEGNLFISVEKDIFIRNGRDLNCLTGGNLNLRARKNIEETSSEGHFKIKAQKDIGLHAVENGILLETQSTEQLGIRIRAKNNAAILLDSEGSITLDSNNNIIRSDQETKIQSGIFSVDSSFTSLKAENEVLLKTGDPIGEQGNQSAIGGAVTIDTSTFQSRNNFFNNVSQNFELTGSGSGFIHGGPNGTNVNLNFGTGDSNFGGFKALKITRIIRNNNPRTLDLGLSTRPFSTNDELLSPFTFDEIKQPTFSFSTNVYDADLFEHNWQKEGPEVWNLQNPEQDIFVNENGEETAPFPGPGYDRYKKYTPNADIDNGDEPLETGGEFEDETLENYLLPSFEATENNV